MGDRKIVNEILAFIPTVNFREPIDNSHVSVFETTIRYLGGLISAYDLLGPEGPYAHLVEKPQVGDNLMSYDSITHEISTSPN